MTIREIAKTHDDGLINNDLAVLEYKHATATVRVSVAEEDGIKRRRLIFCGTNGTAELYSAEPREYYTVPLTVRFPPQNGNEQYAAGTHKVNCGFLNDRYDRQLIGFAEIIRGEITNPYPASHECLLHEVFPESCGVLNDMTAGCPL